MLRLVNADDVKDIICRYENRKIQRTMVYAVERLKGYAVTEEQAEQLLGDRAEFVDMNRISPVGGVDRGVKMDRISLKNAVETPFWMAVWATEPDRKICVEMSYEDLKIITDLIDAAMGGLEPVN